MNPRQGKRSVRTLVWNPETKECLGRTRASWGKFGLFYFIFYLCLAGFSAVLLKVFFLTTNDKFPRYSTPSESLLKNPTLVFRPKSNSFWDKRHQHTYNTSNSITSNPFVSSLETFLEPYQQAANGSTSAFYRKCTDLKGYSGDNQTKPCLYNLTQALSGLNPPCNQDNQWGWHSGSPCIFLRLNRMIKFFPVPTQNISAEVRNQIEDTYGNLGEKLSEHLLLWCESETKGVELVQPYPFLPLHYFPYVNQPHYLSPLVVVRVDAVSDKDSKVKCKVWAKNVREKVEETYLGVVYFTFHISTAEGDRKGREEKAKHEEGKEK